MFDTEHIANLLEENFVSPDVEGGAVTDVTLTQEIDRCSN